MGDDVGVGANRALVGIGMATCLAALAAVPGGFALATPLLVVGAILVLVGTFAPVLPGLRRLAPAKTLAKQQDRERSERELREALQLVRHDMAHLQARGQEERKKGEHWGETNWTELSAIARWDKVGPPLGGYRSLEMVARFCSYPYRIAEKINRLAAEPMIERRTLVPGGGIYQLDELIKATTKALAQIDAALARDSMLDG